jgi:hypothetical protein
VAHQSRNELRTKTQQRIAVHSRLSATDAGQSSILNSPGGSSRTLLVITQKVMVV